MISQETSRSSNPIHPTNPCLSKYLSLTLTVCGIIIVVGGLIARYYGLNVIALNLWILGGSSFLVGIVLMVLKNLDASQKISQTQPVPTPSNPRAKVLENPSNIIYALSLGRESFQKIDNNQYFIRKVKLEKLQAINQEFLDFLRSLDSGITETLQHPEDKLVDAITNRGLDPNILLPNETNDPLILWLYRYGFLSIVSTLLYTTKNLNLNAANSLGETFLSMAMLKEDECMVSAALEKGGNPNTIIPDQVTVLNLSIEIDANTSRSVVDQLKQNKNIEFPIAGTSLLQWSINGDFETITEQALLSEETNPNIKNKKGETAVSAAMKKENGDLVLRLVKDCKGEVNTQLPDDGTSLLQWAIERELSVLIGQLYIGKADPNLPNHKKETAVTAAMQKNDSALVLQLLELKGNPNTVLPECGTSLLQWAIEGSHQAVWKKAIALKANLHLKNKAGKTPYEVATHLQDPELTAELLNVDPSSLAKWKKKK